MATLEDLADNVIIILLAYGAAFLPWSAVSATDFISPVWKKVSTTFREGLVNLVFAAVPAVYIAFYIFLQAQADHKEMFAAIVALFFSILHFARTCWGLWQLIVFRRWAANSIRSLRLMGIRYGAKVTSNQPELDPFEIANNLKVNDTVIDNQLFHGHARCYLQYDTAHFRVDYDRGGIFFQRLSLGFRLIFLVIHYLRDRFIYVFRGGILPRIRQLPHRPAQVWLNWSVAFAAQGLGEWISDFTAAEDPDSMPWPEGVTNKRLYNARRAYFAGEVLASAGLHLWQTSRKAGAPSPLVWTQWGEDGSDVCDGRITKNELLWNAVLSGDGLPFEAPHTDLFSNTHINRSGVDGNGDHGCYSGYTRRLRRVIESVPISFGPEIEDFDINKLEWLAILLNLGTIFSKSDQERNLVEKPLGVDSTMQPDDDSPSSDDDTWNDSSEMCVDDGDLALDNLRIQLGFGCEEKALKAPEKGIASFSAFPLPNYALRQISTGNRLATSAGELIDIWLALIAGEQLRFLMKLDAKWCESCLGDHQPDAYRGSQIRSPMISPVAVSPHTIPPPKSYHTNSTLRNNQVRAEKARLAYQYANATRHYWHMEQSLTFMGHLMECVRTHLAHWADMNQDASRADWEPVLFESDRHEVTHWVDLDRLSDNFSCEILKARDTEYLKRRAIQAHILWELRKSLQQRLASSSKGPKNIYAMMLCIIAFPSLTLEVEKDLENDDSADVKVDEGREVCNIFFGLKRRESKPSGGHGIARQWTMNLRAQCAPQRLMLVVRFTMHETKGFLMQACVKRDRVDHDHVFQWEWWRDAFMSRLEGLKQWQASHDMRFVDLHGTDIPISEGTRGVQVILKGTGKSFRTWCGWAPFRFEFCRFELESRGFLLHFESAKVVNIVTGESKDDARRHRLPRAERRALPYSEAEREQIRNASFVVREVISEAGLDEDYDRVVLSTADRAKGLIDSAERLLCERKENFDRSVLLLEVAAVELGNVEALRRCVELLTDSHSTTNDPRRAARLIENCLAGFVKRQRGLHARLSSIEDDLSFSQYHSLFENLVVRDGFTADVVLPFSKYLGVIIQFDNEASIARTFCWFRKMFLVARRFEILEILSTAMRSFRVISAQDADVDLSEESCTHELGVVSEGDDDARKRALYVLSKTFYERAVLEAQDVGSMNELGLLLQRGAPGIERDAEMAQQLFERAMTKGSFYAMNNLGALLLEGARGVRYDPSTAAELFRKAIAKGKLVGAMFNLGVLLRKGAGVKKDTKEAAKWFERAIEEGQHVKAMVLLGHIVENGEGGVERDAKRAKELYELAIAEGPDMEAIERLALLLESGADGVERDLGYAVNLRGKLEEVGAISRYESSVMSA